MGRRHTGGRTSAGQGSHFLTVPVQLADNTRMANHDWNGVARRYIDLYQLALRRAA